MARTRWGLMAGAGAVLACTGPAAPSERSTGGIALSVVPGPGAAAALDSGYVVVQGPTTLTVKVAPGTVDTIGGLAPGTYAVALEGFAGGGVDHFGQTSGVRVVAGRDTVASLVFAPFQASPPTVDTMTLGKRVRLHFSPVLNAMRYQVEWSTDLSFASGVTATPVRDTTAQIVVPNYAYYYFRVRGVDPYLRLGRPSATRFSSVLAAMYIADAGGPSAVVFVGPFTATSRPAIAVPVSGSPVGMAVDTAGDMAVCGVGMGVGDSVQLFAPAITSGSVPVTKLAVAGCLFMAFDVAGNLYVASQTNSVSVFPAPFPFTAAPSHAIVRGLSQAKSVAFDAAHWLYVGNDTAAAPPCTVCRVNVYSPPYAADTLFSVGHGRLTSVGGIALDAAGNLYVADVNASKIVVYQAPLSGAPDSAFTITAGLSTPEGIAFDAAGNLYVVNLNGTVTIYRPPFSRASAPAVTIPASAGLRGPYGIALDK